MITYYPCFSPFPFFSELILFKVIYFYLPFINRNGFSSFLLGKGQTVPGIPRAAAYERVGCSGLSPCPELLELPDSPW